VYNTTLKDCAFVDCSVAIAGPPLSERSKNLPVLTGLFEVGEEKEYFTTHTIDNCTVNGEPIFYAAGMEEVIIPEDTGMAICVDCGSVIAKNVGIHDASMGMILAYNDKVYLENCQGDNCGVFGIYVCKSTDVILEGCSADGTNHGLDIRACTGVRLQECGATNCDQGLFFAKVKNGMFINCTVKNTGQGYFTAGSNCVFTACKAIDCENGINIQKDAAPAVVYNCEIKGCSVCGVRLDGTGATFVNNRLIDNWVGVMAYGGVSFFMQDNVFEGNRSCGLYLRDITYSSFINNIFTGHQKTSVEANGEMSKSVWINNTMDIPVTMKSGAVFAQ